MGQQDLTVQGMQSFTLEGTIWECRFAEKATGFLVPARHKVEHEPAMCPCSKGSQWTLGLH